MKYDKEIYGSPPKPETLTLNWITGDYPERVKDIEDYIISHIFWNEWGGKIDSRDDSQIIRAMAETRSKAWLETGRLEQAISMSGVRQLYKISQNNVWAQLPNEYETIEEWLNDKWKETERIETLPDGTEKIVRVGTYWDIKFLVKELLPALKSMGVDVDKLTTIPENFSKTRHAVPFLRKHLDHLVSNNAMDDDTLEKTRIQIDRKKEKGEDVTEAEDKWNKYKEDIETTKLVRQEEFMGHLARAFEIVSDPTKTTYHGVDKSLLQGEQPYQLDMLTGDQIFLPNEMIYVIKVPNNSIAHQKVIEMRLKVIVDRWRINDAMEITKGMLESLTGKEVSNENLRNLIMLKQRQHEEMPI